MNEPFNVEESMDQKYQLYEQRQSVMNLGSLKCGFKTGRDESFISDHNCHLTKSTLLGKLDGSPKDVDSAWLCRNSSGRALDDIGKRIRREHANVTQCAEALLPSPLRTSQTDFPAARSYVESSFPDGSSETLTPSWCSIEGIGEGESWSLSLPPYHRRSNRGVASTAQIIIRDGGRLLENEAPITGDAATLAEIELFQEFFSSPLLVESPQKAFEHCSDGLDWKSTTPTNEFRKERIHGGQLRQELTEELSGPEASTGGLIGNSQTATMPDARFTPQSSQSFEIEENKPQEMGSSDKRHNVISHNGEERGAKAHQTGEHSFPWRLHDMLEDAERNHFTKVVSWELGGKGFKVHNHEMFLDDIMPLYFDQTKYESFRRQLNLYGFSRISRGQDRGVYRHKMFDKRARSNCQYVTRRVATYRMPSNII